MITMKNQFKKNSCNSDACTKSKFFSQDNDVPTVMEKNAPLHVRFFNHDHTCVRISM